MAQGQRLTKEHKNYIAEIYHQHPDWVAKEVREQFHRHFGLKGEWPGLSAIQKAVHDIREADNKRSLEAKAFDELWSLGSLSDHPIPPEAMPIVMSVYKKALAENEELTIREAQWIARLYKIIDPPDLVWDWAWEYAITEWISEVTNTPFDTTELDSKLISDIYCAQREHSKSKRQNAIWGIAEKLNPDFRAPGADFNALFDAVSADFNALMELNLSIEETEEIAKSGKYKKEAQNERVNKAKR